MRNFLIEVRKATYASHIFEIEAEDIGQAKLKALDESNDYEFEEDSSDCEVTWSKEKE
jgi:hypothetical protein